MSLLMAESRTAGQTECISEMSETGLQMSGNNREKYGKGHQMNAKAVYSLDMSRTVFCTILSQR